MATLLPRYLHLGAVMSLCPDARRNHDHAYYPPQVLMRIMKEYCNNDPQKMEAYLGRKRLVYLTKDEYNYIVRQSGGSEIKNKSYVQYFCHDFIPKGATSFSL